MTDVNTREPEPAPPSSAAPAPAPATSPDVSGAPPRWARAAVYGCGAVVGGAALAASAADLYGLAGALGFTQTTCVAVPVGLDAGASTTGVLWITAPATSAARRQWRGATLGLVGASAVLNGLSVLAGPHWLTDSTAQGLPDVGLLSGAVAVVIAVVIAFAFPLVAAWMVHAVLAVRDAATRAAPGAAADPVATVPAPVTAPALAAPTGPSSVPAELPPVPADSPSPAAHPAVPPVVPTQREEREEQPREPSPHREDTTPTDGTGGPDVSEGAPGPAGETRPGELAPPAPTGHKMTDARAWFRHERAHGRTPRPVEVNRAIGSDGYVKTTHIEGWDRELADEHEHRHDDEHGVVPGHDDHAPASASSGERLRLVDTR